MLFYGAYDVLGALYLWWTWHTTDAATSTLTRDATETVLRRRVLPMGEILRRLSGTVWFAFAVHPFEFSKNGRAKRSFLAATGVS